MALSMDKCATKVNTLKDALVPLIGCTITQCMH